MKTFGFGRNIFYFIMHFCLLHHFLLNKSPCSSMSKLLADITLQSRKVYISCRWTGTGNYTLRTKPLLLAAVVIDVSICSFRRPEGGSFSIKSPPTPLNCCLLPNRAVLLLQYAEVHHSWHQFDTTRNQCRVRAAENYPLSSNMDGLLPVSFVWMTITGTHKH